MYDKFLQCFVASVDDPRESLQQPRPQSGNIYASDARTAARVNAELCESAYSAHDRQPDFASAISDIECPLLMDIGEVALAIANDPEEEPQYHHRKCPECCGEKYVTWEYKDSDGEMHEMEYDCYVCHGSGMMPDLVQEQVDRYISINGVLYTMELIKKVLNAIYSLGIGQVSFGISSRNIGMIRICPGVDCWVMTSIPEDIKPSCCVTLKERRP